MQVVWNAWLSTLGHAPMVDPTDLLHKMGGDSAASHLSEHVAPALAHTGAAISDAVSPFVHQATVVRTCAIAWLLLGCCINIDGLIFLKRCVPVPKLVS